jgi:hypothetical protein
VATAVPAGLSPELAASAHDTLSGALDVAAQLSDPNVAASLALTARHGLTSAVAATSVIAAVISILSALGVLLYFDARQARTCTSVGACEAEPITLA